MTDAPPTEPAKRTRPDAEARDAYLAGLRRGRLIYTAVIAVLVVAIGLVVTVVYQHGEIAHTRLVTVAKPPAPVVTTKLATPTGQMWTSTDQLAVSAPYIAGTVVTFDAHTVRGRDGRTGTQTWSYTRSNRTVCTAVQSGGITLALFRVNGNCDQLTALDSKLGSRLWTRTYSLNGQPINGTPTVLVSNETLVLSTPSVIYATAINRTDGLDRWQFSREGCAIGPVAYGSAGALISMNCANTNACKSGEKFCAAGQQLILRDPYAGHDDSKTENPDMIKWNLAKSYTPVSAGAQILARDGEQLVVLGAVKGKEGARLDLTNPGETTEMQQLSDSELVWTGGQLYQIVDSQIAWNAATSALPTVTTTDGQDPSSANGLLTVPGAGGVDYIGIIDGTLKHTVPLTGLTPNSKVYPYGSGFIVGDSSGTTVWL